MSDPVPGSEETPWEPPLAGTEVEQVLGAVERMRWTFRWKVDGLDAAALGQQFGASTLSLGGLLKHLAVIEDHTFQVKLTGAPMPGIWDENGWDEDADWEHTSASDDSPEVLYALWDSAVERSRTQVAQALTRGDLDQEVHAAAHGEHASLRRLLLDHLEECGRHLGHADLLREAVDGRTGEDPPPGWRPGQPAASAEQD